jgi:pyridoxamine 5'-phosphate oxidase
MSDLSSLYTTASGLPDPLPDEPLSTVAAWLADATAREVTPNPNAIALATVDADGRPSVRMVLCKDIDAATGSLTFYTNYQSRKGRALDATGRAAGVLHWDADERQVRVEGLVRRTTPQESDAYFASRHWQSRIGAWASRQSEPIESREALLMQVAEAVIEQGIDLREVIDAGPDARPSIDIKRPPHWGGYRLFADRVELWVGGAGRIHDRMVWEREFAPASQSDPRGVDGAAPVVASGWERVRLQP